MKILFPCPGCRHPLVLPQHASSLAKLRCSVCGHKLTAESIFLDSSRLGSEWEVLQDSGTDNVFEALYTAASLRDLDPTFINGQVLREPTVVVPPSNEWETQPSSLLIDESIETDKEYQIANESRPSEVGNRGETGEFQTDSMPDEMIGVSDEPWFSPTEPPTDAIAEQEIESNDPQIIDFDVPFDEKPKPPNDNTPESLPEDLEFELEDEPVLTLDDEEEFEAIDEPEVVSKSQETANMQATAEARPRATQKLPAELLGNSSSVLRSRKKSNPIGTLLSIMGGGAAAIPISILLMWYALGKDPLTAGPIVANFVPWIVPEKFQGGRLSKTENLPEMPPMVGPGFSDIDSGAPMKLPSIGDSASTETSTQPTTEAPSELAMKPVDEPSPSVGRETVTRNAEPTNPLAMAPTIDSASIPEMPKLDPVSQAPSAALPSNIPPVSPPNEIASLSRPEPTISKIQQSILNLNKAIDVFDGGAYESGAILFRALEAFGEQLASIPESSPEHADFRSKGFEVVEKIASSAEMLKSFRKFMTTSQGNTELFPGESLQSREPTVTVDIVEVGSIKKGDNYDTWAITQRFQSALEQRPIIVPHDLKTSATPTSKFLVLGISEVDPSTRELVLRAFMAVQKK